MRESPLLLIPSSLAKRPMVSPSSLDGGDVGGRLEDLRTGAAALGAAAVGVGDVDAHGARKIARPFDVC